MAEQTAEQAWSTDEDTKVSKPIEVLFEFAESQNIAADMDQDELNLMGEEVFEDYEEDESSLDQWREQYKKGVNLANQLAESKTWPWKDASNVKYPLIGQAAMNFNARAYPEIVQGDKVVKADIVGEDPGSDKANRAERISDHMNYQLTAEIPNWEQDTDKLLIQLPIVGTMFREITWDEINLRPEINLLMPTEITVNFNSKSLDLTDCRRISKQVTKFKNDILERERADLWLEIDYSEEGQDGTKITKSEQDFIQQLRYLDLDDDGYEEPYMVTIHCRTKKVVRIVANYDPESIVFNPENGEIQKIEPFKIYTDYHFIPSFEGGFYSIGFGQYLNSINESLNSLINQLIDAGTLNNLQAGFFGKGLRMKGGARPMEPGEWRPVQSKGLSLKDNIVPLPTKEPSRALMELAIFLLETGKEMSSITDILSGVPQGQNTPVGTTLAMIEQGMKVMDAIYKRVYRSMHIEFTILYRINSYHLDLKQYQKILDNPEAKAEDYRIDDLDIMPVGDPQISSQMVRVIKAQAARDVAMSTPGANLQVASRRLLEAMDIQNVDEIIPEVDTDQLMQQVEYLQGMVETFQGFIQSGQLQMLMDENRRDNAESGAKVAKDISSAVKNIADAEAAEVGEQLDIYASRLSSIKQTFDQQREVAELEQQQINQRGLPAMGAPAGNSGGP